MKKSIMLIAALCMTSVMTFAQKVIRVSTDKTDLVMKVSPKGRLYLRAGSSRHSCRRQHDYLFIL